MLFVLSLSAEAQQIGFTILKWTLMKADKVIK